MRAGSQTKSEAQLAAKAFGYVRTHWWLLAIEAVCLIGFQIYRYAVTPPLYESSAAILIDNSRRQMYNEYLFRNNMKEKKRNLVHLLTSNEVMERFQRGLTEHNDIQGRPKYLRPYFPNGRALPANDFRNHIYLDWNQYSDIYNIRCTAKAPAAAHDLCLIYMDAIVAYYPEVGQREAVMKREFLSRQIDLALRRIEENQKKKQKLEAENIEFVRFRNQAGQRQGLARKIAQLKRAIEENRQLTNLLLNVPQAKRGEHISLQQSITQLSRQISELQYQAQLTRQSTDPKRDERMASINREIANISSQLADLNERQLSNYIKAPLKAEEVKNRLAKLEFDYRVNQIRLEAVRNQAQKLEAQARKFRPLMYTHERIKAEIEHRKQSLQRLYKQEQETDFELSAGQAEVFRLREPGLNRDRVAPKLTNYVYRGISLSIFLMAVTVLMLMVLQPRLDSEQEVAALNLPVLGKVPILSLSGPNPEDIPSFALEHTKIMSYRIQRETRDTKCPIIVVSSSNAREGKSTVTHCLSVASRSSERRTLLIDGDLVTMRPNNFLRIHEDQTPGLRGILQETTTDPEELIVKTTVEGVSFMPRGGRIDPLEMPHKLTKVYEFLDSLRGSYDMIFLDTPPLFASNLAHQWVEHADLVVLVARIFRTRPKDIIESMQTCKNLSRAPVGIALNYLPLSTADRRASNYYFSRRKTSSRMAA